MEAFDYIDAGQLPAEVCRALDSGFPSLYEVEPATEQATSAVRWAARIGYMSRVAEWERVPAAQKPRGSMVAGLRQALEASLMDELGEAEVSFYDALCEVTAFFVRREPLDVPYDAEEGFKPMWTVPGMGGDFRAMLRQRTLAVALGPYEAELQDAAGPNLGPVFDCLPWVWKFGFLLRAFEEFFTEE
jgi:hypothetical protein